MHYGYIGLGNLGGHIAQSLIRKGFKVTVYDLDPKLAERHIKAGAAWAASPKELASQVDHVFTCLPSPTVSEKVLVQILDGLKPDDRVVVEGLLRAIPGQKVEPKVETLTAPSQT